MTVKEKKAEDDHEKEKIIERERKGKNVRSMIEEVEKGGREVKLGLFKNVKNITATDRQKEKTEDLEKEGRIRKVEKKCGKKKESVKVQAQNPDKLKRKKTKEGGIGGIIKVADKGGSGATFTTKITNFKNIFSGREGAKRLAESKGLTWEPSGGGGEKLKEVQESEGVGGRDECGD